jgi:hypothetical protein
MMDGVIRSRMKAAKNAKNAKNAKILGIRGGQFAARRLALTPDPSPIAMGEGGTRVESREAR